MAVIRFLAFAVFIAGLLPPGTEMLDDLVRELLSAKHQAVFTTVSSTGQTEPIGSARELCALPQIPQSACTLP